MRIVLLAAAFACLAGCDKTSQQFDLASADGGVMANPPAAETDPTGTITTVTNATLVPAGSENVQPATDGLIGSNQNDDLNMGKRHFRERDYGLAERYFRRAVEMSPRDAEAWVGLAACYDRLRRFDHADRAYRQALAILGPTPEILNNQGYSYLLRGDYKRARTKLYEARAKDPANPRIQNNIELLEESLARGKGVAAN
ncbi:MAG TPA: tetratricopeptide repeat protein [Xanthobacteraceae bacterium]|nr:tetratricopeptide repeat protein [Xanthobacteraceae bacterium]